MEYLLLLLALSFPQSKPASFVPNPYKTSCIMRNIGVMVADHETGTEREAEDWYVDCRITFHDNDIYKATLIIAHPCTFTEAARAVDEFRTKKAAEVAALHRKGKLKEEEK